MKFASDRPFSDPEKAARKLVEIANSIDYVELINAPFLYEHQGSPAEYKAGLDLAIARGWVAAMIRRSSASIPLELIIATIAAR
jgi:hypothetical protein